MNDKDHYLEPERAAISPLPLDTGTPVGKERTSLKTSDKWLKRVDRALDVCRIALSSNNESQREFYSGCQEALTTFRAELKEATTSDEKKYWTTQISSTLDQMYNKDYQNKLFILGIASIAVAGPVFLLIARAVIKR